MQNAKDAIIAEKAAARYARRHPQEQPRRRWA